MIFKDIPYKEVAHCIFQIQERLRSAILAESPARMAYEMGKLNSDLCRWLDAHCVQEESE